MSKVTEASWIIGSDTSCDVVVGSPTVSSRHCRLEMVGRQLRLTDLDSTNGTFVNGERLMGSQVVSTSDKITLGQSFAMPWPDALRPQADVASAPRANSEETQVITLGRGQDNTLVLEGSNISTHHARLLVGRNEITLEDLGSTNGTAVGSVENKINRQTVQQSDTIFLGSTPFRIADLLAQASTTTAKPTPKWTRSQPAPPARSSKAGAWLAMGAGAVLLCLFTWWMAQQRETTGESESEVASTENKTSATSTVERPDTAEPVATLTPEQRLAQSLLLIICADAEEKTPFRVGTAFAIESHRLATSASAILAIEELNRNGFPNARLYSPATGATFTIRKAQLHPEFRAAQAKCRASQQRHDALIDEMEASPPDPEELDELKQQLLSLRTSALQAIDAKSACDVAVISVVEPLEHWLPISHEDANLRPGQKIAIRGYAFDVEDPFFDQAATQTIANMEGRIGQLLATDAGRRRLLGRGTREQLQYAYLGCPALNEQQEVVAVYSRPLPDLPGETEEPDQTGSAESLFDAALAQRVRECLAQAEL